MAEEEPVYTAYYEWDPDTGPDVPVYRAVFDFVPGQDQGPGAAVVEARRIWADFLPRAHQHPPAAGRTGPAQRFSRPGSARMLRAVRGPVLRLAEGCDDQFRVDLAEHFLWERNASFIHREMPDETEVMLARLEAYRSYLRRRP
ncbi:hypothetical protein LP419_25130 [Massilia sp. H-1]|nr:hypothetical protein LP419_25130 [Massilia sp. H-1]